MQVVNACENRVQYHKDFPVYWSVFGLVDIKDFLHQKFIFQALANVSIW